MRKQNPVLDTAVITEERLGLPALIRSMGMERGLEAW